MSAIAEQLDAKLKELDANAASLLEKLVRDALDLLDLQNGAGRAERLPENFFTRIAQAQELGEKILRTTAAG